MMPQVDKLQQIQQWALQQMTLLLRHFHSLLLSQKLFLFYELLT